MVVERRLLRGKSSSASNTFNRFNALPVKLAILSKVHHSTAHAPPIALQQLCRAHRPQAPLPLRTACQWTFAAARPGTHTASACGLCARRSCCLSPLRRCAQRQGACLSHSSAVPYRGAAFLGGSYAVQQPAAAILCGKPATAFEETNQQSVTQEVSAAATARKGRPQA
jgi:hypothetical protein